MATTRAFDEHAKEYDDWFDRSEAQPEHERVRDDYGYDDDDAWDDDDDEDWIE